MMWFGSKAVNGKWGQAIAIMAAAALFVASGCSSSSGNLAVPTFAKGVVSAKGSIFVNGIEYDTGATKITVNDSAGNDSDLKVGMVVEVKGSADSTTGKGTATEVLYSADVDGPVSSINLTAKTFVIFGRTIATDATTVWDGLADITSLNNGDRVEVSGSVDLASKILKADRVQKKPVTAEDYETKGIVSVLSPSSFVLTLADGSGSYTVNFTGSLATGIANGSTVEIKFQPGNLVGSTISVAAAKIKSETHLNPEDRSQGEVSGVVSSYVAGSPASFVVDDVQVSADPTLLPGGFANGIHAEVKGVMSSGVLVASSVKTEQEPNAELMGSVYAVSTALGSLTVNGVAISVDANTRFRDEKGSSPVEHFGLASVQIGDTVELSGYYSASALPNFLARRVERQSPSATAMLRGAVSAANATSLTILGQAVDISTATFKDSGGAAVANGTAFAALITLGTTPVVVKGSFSGSAFTASSAEIDD